jgi:hypothetical protein
MVACLLYNQKGKCRLHPVRPGAPLGPRGPIEKYSVFQEKKRGKK